MLAYLPEREQSALLRELKLEKHTERTLTTHRELLDDFAKIRSRGFAVDQAEHFDGIHCVAAPLLDRHGLPVAAITIAGPSSRIQPRRFNELGDIMKRAAQDASRRYLG
jgi:DNA-binding IclR family transcriptional regulator